MPKQTMTMTEAGERLDAVKALEGAVRAGQVPLSDYVRAHEQDIRSVLDLGIRSVLDLGLVREMAEQLEARIGKLTLLARGAVADHGEQ